MADCFKIIFSLFLALALCSAAVSALGITPGRTTLSYEPGKVQTVSVTVINSDAKDVVLAVYVRGALNESITLRDTSLSMNLNEREKQISFDVRMPYGLKPGLHSADVVVMQSPEQLPQSKTTVGMALAVATQVHVFVPYPGKYLEGELKVLGDEKEKKFYAVVTNRGTERIERAHATIAIFDGAGKRVKTIESNDLALVPNEKRELAANWIVDVPRGRYTARAVVDYDGEKVLFESGFEIGEFALELLDLYVEDFTLGGIAKFNMLVQNQWNEPITQAYTSMRVLDSDFNELADIKSAAYDIPPDKKTTMVYYWDTKDIVEGLYNANILLYYGDKKTQHDLKLDVRRSSIQVIGLGRVVSNEEGKGNGSLVIILGVIIGFLILLNVLWFVILRKRKP